MEDRIMAENSDKSLLEWTSIYRDWLFTAALPIWSEKGLDRQRGGFLEALALDGSLPETPRRARVQGRQSFVFSTAGKLGWHGSWEASA
jgi:mannose/cellobiose epimerase-like protein (N-acyl-D-glucosamine 2-epimerase family)